METAAREFQIMVKTIGAICNLDCHYCYYLEKEDLYPKGTNFRLDDETLEALHPTTYPGNARRDRQFFMARRRADTARRGVFPQGRRLCRKSTCRRTRKSSTAFKPTARRSMTNGASFSPRKIFTSVSASTGRESCTITTASPKDKSRRTNRSCRRSKCCARQGARRSALRRP